MIQQLQGWSTDVIGSITKFESFGNNGGFSTFRQFGNIALNGNSDNGHQFIVLYPSSSQVFQKPNSLRIRW